MNSGDTVRELAARLLSAADVPALARRRMRGRLAILMYHGVTAEPPSPPCPYVVDVATLQRQLEFVREHFNVLPLEEALERLRAGTLPDKAVALTFDDGTRNIATNAAPILRRLRLPAAVFLSTGPMGTEKALWADQLWMSFAHTRLPHIDLAAIDLGTLSLRDDQERGAAWATVTARLKELDDQERLARFESLVATLGPEPDISSGPFQMLSWEEAQALAADDFVTLHPHSVTHPILSRCTDDKLEYEVSESCRVVEKLTGCPPTIFAYPNGHEDDFDERARAALLRNGIRWALSTTRGLAQRDSDPLALPRIGITGDVSMARFQLQISGVPSARQFADAATYRRRRNVRVLKRRLLGAAASAIDSARGKPNWTTYDSSSGHWVKRTRGGITLVPRARGMSAEECVDWVRDVFMHRHTVGRGEIVVDIGAGVGTELLPTSRMVGSSGKVIAVEAHPATFAALERVCRLNGVKNAELLHVAASDTDGVVKISDLPPTDSIKNRLGDTGVEVPAITLTNLVAKFNLERIDFLKMNIEGAEVAALRGARDVLPLVRHAAIGCHDFLADQTGDESYRTKDAVREILQEAGFTVTARDEDPRPWAADFLFASRES